jgi:Flp pilus assembly protein TadD
MDPKWKDAHYNLGTSFTQSGETGKAVSAFKKALELDPRNTDYHNSLGYAYRDMDMDSMAKFHFEKAIKISQFADSYVNLSSLYDKQGEREKTFEILCEAVTANRENIAARGNLLLYSLDAQVYHMNSMKHPMPDMLVIQILK